MRVPQFFRGYDCNPTLYCRGMILIGAGVKWLDMFVKHYNLPPVLQRMKNVKMIFFSILVVGLIAELIVYKSIIPKGSLLIHSPFSVIIMIQLLLLVLMSLIWGTNGMR